MISLFPLTSVEFGATSVFVKFLYTLDLKKKCVCVVCVHIHMCVCVCRCTDRPLEARIEAGVTAGCEPPNMRTGIRTLVFMTK